MNYAVYAVVALLIAWGGYESIRAADAERDLATLKLSYDQAGEIAQAHAQAVEAKQDAAIKTQTDKALSQASAATSKANASKAVYDAKLAAIAKQKPTDLPHICANVLIPADLK